MARATADSIIKNGFLRFRYKMKFSIKIEIISKERPYVSIVKENMVTGGSKSIIAMLSMAIFRSISKAVLYTINYVRRFMVIYINIIPSSGILKNTLRIAREKG